jgi:hypothetical protein
MKAETAARLRVSWLGRGTGGAERVRVGRTGRKWPSLGRNSSPSFFISVFVFYSISNLFSNQVLVLIHTIQMQQSKEHVMQDVKFYISYFTYSSNFFYKVSAFTK